MSVSTNNHLLYNELSDFCAGAFAGFNQVKSLPSGRISILKLQSLTSHDDIE